MDDPYRLLITHAEQWSAKARRPLDVDLLETALSLRDTHDRRPGTSWPQGSAAELMTVRWPGHGPLDPPDVEVLVATLETFWRFLRATGRMASGSADVKALTREARRSVASMRDRLADPAAYGASKSLLAFGREIGITMEDLETIEEANARFAAITEAWNALPQQERLARSPGPAGAGSQASAAMTATANQLLAGVDLTEYAATHGMSQPEEEDDAIPVQDVRVVAEQVRRSGYQKRLRSLVDWIGPDGKPVTAAGLLRPATAREAIADLELDDWMLAELGERPPTWRSAGDHLGLDRLYRGAVEAGFLDIRSTRVIAIPETDTDDQEWVVTGLIALIAAYERVVGHLTSDPLLGMLLSVGLGDARTVEDVVAWWGHSPVNTLNRLVTDRLDPAQAAELSQAVARANEAAIDGTLAYWRDTGIIRERANTLTVTELGLDFTRVLIRLHEHEESSGERDD
ncbi:MAG: hypothetical protein ABIQ61_02870 [Ornithinibacter sp.]